MVEHRTLGVASDSEYEQVEDPAGDVSNVLASFWALSLVIVAEAIMSVDVRFDFRIKNAGSRGAELGARLEQIIAKEGFRDDLSDLMIHEGVVYLQSTFPTIISSSYSYLPKLRERLVELETDGAVVQMLTSIDGSEFAEEVLSPVASNPEPAATTKPKAEATAKTGKARVKVKAATKAKAKTRKAKAKATKKVRATAKMRKAKTKTKANAPAKTKTKPKATARKAKPSTRAKAK